MSDVRRFRSGDFDEVAAWWEHNGRKLEQGDLPQLGFIAPGLAAGFLYLTDSNVAFADGLLSNPKAPILARARAASVIVDRLTEEAKACGFKYVAGVCGVESTKRLCLKKGFTRDGSYEMLLKEIG